MISGRTISREIGTAFAVLAIYLLTVLAPLHQARASQLVFEELGYATSQTGWVLCTPANPGGDDPDLSVAKCPATGVGKTDLAVPDLAILPAPHRLPALSAPRPAAFAFHSLPVGTPPSGPRAPPVLV